MSNKEIAMRALDRAFVVYAEEQDAIDTNNGILNDEYLAYQKRRVLKKAISYLADDLVKHKQSYPQNNLSDVKLTTDLIVMERKDFDKIEQLIKDINE